jgi:hypothetical protein
MRVVVSILSKEYQRNIIDSGALDELARTHQIDFMTPIGLNLDLPPLFANCNVYKFSLDAKDELRAGFKFEVNARNKRHLSSSFKYRSARKYSNLFLFIIRQLGFEYKFVDSNLHKIFKTRPTLLVMIKKIRKLQFRRFLVATYYFYRNKLRQFFIYILGSPLLFSLSTLFFEKQSRINEELMTVIPWQEYDFIIHISSAHEKTGSDLVKIANQISKPIVFIIDNWDNLSSKTVLSELPDYLMVWGEQSRRHAIDIQGFTPSRVFNLGSARFQEYFTARNRELASHFNYPYVIFAGTFLPFDEISNLKLIDLEIESKKEIYGDLRIVYRPHPANSSYLITEFYKSDFRHVILDPQIMQYSKPQLNQVKEKMDLLKLDYYPSLIKNSKFIVGGLTSFLIESSVFSKEYLTLVYSEPFSINSPRRVFREYTHYREISSLPNVTLIHHRQDLSKSFRDTFQTPKSPSRKEVDVHLMDFLEINEKSTFGIKLRLQLELLHEQHLICCD